MFRLTSAHTIALSVTFVLAGSGYQTVEAQNQGLTQNQGQSGNTATSAARATANGATGSQNFGATQQQSFGATGGTSAAQQAAQSGQFVGRGTDSSQFVGRGSAGQQSSRGQSSQFGRGSQSSRRNVNQSRGSTTRNLRVVRPRVRVAFTHPTIPTANLTTNLSGQLQRFTVQNKLPNVRFEVDQASTVVLRGEVPSNGTRRLLEIVARMEPGVRKVRNELVVLADAGDAGDETP